MNRQRKPVAPNESRQAERFPIRVPVRYREFGESEWHAGMSENISSAGVFFRCNQRTAIQKHVEIDFVLRGGYAELLTARVVCLGRIVRAELKADSSGMYVLAARIESYHLLQCEGPVM